MKREYIKIRVLAFTFFALILNRGNKLSAQELNKGIINSSGGSNKTSDYIFDYNIGEMLAIDTYQMPGLILTQGILQPIFQINNQVYLSSIVVNNMISPNGDGINDLLVFENIEKYGKNKLVIYDRNGRFIYSTINYKNNWNGFVNDQKLPEGTYYYILELESESKQKGFVTIIHD